MWVGTRFIATPVARAVPGYKEKILEAADDGT
jgi:enoyl-[acyl-carrier protein] reductase II